MPHAGKTDDSRIKGPPRVPKAGDATTSPPLFRENEIDGSMHTEEPMGSDLAPLDIHDPEKKRHPRPDGIGGLMPADNPEDKITEKSTG